MNIFKKLYYIITFIAIYIVMLIKSNFVIAYDILSPKMYNRPAFIRVPLTVKSEFGLLLFSNLLSMTPGTLAIDITEDRKIMLVHILYRRTKNETLVEIEEIQQKIKRITG